MNPVVKPLSERHIKILIIKELIELLNDDESPYTITQHVIHILRAKGMKRTYEWDNNDFLVKLQEYKEELNSSIEEDAAELQYDLTH
jgi:hypothetical protein